MKLLYIKQYIPHRCLKYRQYDLCFPIIAAGILQDALLGRDLGSGAERPLCNTKQGRGGSYNPSLNISQVVVSNDMVFPTSTYPFLQTLLWEKHFKLGRYPLCKISAKCLQTSRQHYVFISHGTPLKERVITFLDTSL
jgi:hypothetical protein